MGIFKRYVDVYRHYRLDKSITLKNVLRCEGPLASFLCYLK